MTNITVDNKKHTIELTKKDYDKACKFGTQEYIDLQEARKAYPTYKVVKVTRKAPKSTFKGLTYSYMEKYILAHDDAGQSIMKEYLLLRGETDEALAESANYQEMKDWFLEKFPAIANFHNMRAEMIENTKKAKETKKAESAKAKKTALRKTLLTA